MQRPPRILVVDDDDSTRDVIEELLSSEGYDVRSAREGRTALRMAEEDQPDLILLDMLMPLMDGREFSQAYRRLPGGNAPIVVLTATFDAAASAREIEAHSYLDKPFALEELLYVVHHALEESLATDGNT
jgi:two-component system, OmpR family, response regulator MprA